MIALDSTIRAGFTAISGYPIRGATDISHIAERGVISYEAENYDFHRDTRDDRCNRRIAQLIGSDEDLRQLMAKVVQLVESPWLDLDLPFDLRGTSFEQRVWQALRE